jgi:hypothetical protein
MKFIKDTIDIDRLLKLDENQVLTFKVYPIEPTEIKEHYIKSAEGKMIVEKCTMDASCPYCITFKTLMKFDGSPEVRKWAPHSRYFLPVYVEKNTLVDEGEYVYRFGKQIKDAYIQLLTECDKYKFDCVKPLTFTHQTVDKHGFRDYSKCEFHFGKKSITVEKLCNDASSFRW